MGIQVLEVHVIKSSDVAVDTADAANDISNDN